MNYVDYGPRHQTSQDPCVSLDNDWDLGVTELFGDVLERGRVVVTSTSVKAMPASAAHHRQVTTAHNSPPGPAILHSLQRLGTARPDAFPLDQDTATPRSPEDPSSAQTVCFPMFIRISFT